MDWCLSILFYNKPNFTIDKLRWSEICCIQILYLCFDYCHICFFIIFLSLFKSALHKLRSIEENIEAERASHLETKFNSEIVQVFYVIYIHISLWIYCYVLMIGNDLVYIFIHWNDIVYIFIHLNDIVYIFIHLNDLVYIFI